MRTELMCGQYLDLLEQAHGENTFESALRVALYKSGKYSVEQPLRLGLTLAAGGGAPWIEELCVEYGNRVGIAFQLRDDILGVFGDPVETGQARGRRPARGQAHDAHRPHPGRGHPRGRGDRAAAARRPRPRRGGGGQAARRPSRRAARWTSARR
ncbi:polyprenyl synthetase family protein [Nonomuraea dietziae]|uniref:polyprenyl synthetase family protein n=1 Tax=Nonomuraea dietziae TaxID=65515 RepID=UPI0031CDB74C